VILQRDTISAASFPLPVSLLPPRSRNCCGPHGKEASSSFFFFFFTGGAIAFSFVFRRENKVSHTSSRPFFLLSRASARSSLPLNKKRRDRLPGRRRNRSKMAGRGENNTRKKKATTRILVEPSFPPHFHRPDPLHAPPEGAAGSALCWAPASRAPTPRTTCKPWKRSGLSLREPAAPRGTVSLKKARN
jgi:hypothetical protein